MATGGESEPFQLFGEYLLIVKCLLVWRSPGGPVFWSFVLRVERWNSPKQWISTSNSLSPLFARIQGSCTVNRACLPPWPSQHWAPFSHLCMDKLEFLEYNQILKSWSSNALQHGWGYLIVGYHYCLVVVFFFFFDKATETQGNAFPRPHS